MGSGAQFGVDFGYRPTDAIVDDSLIGLDKYTSGPYQHAAWLITQIRATVGETAFFAGLKKLLVDHGTGDASGSATGEEFIRSFTDLDEATVQKLVAALPTMADAEARGLDRGAVAAGTTPVTITLTDPSGIMMAPIDVTVIGDAGAPTTTSIAPGGRDEHRDGAGGRLPRVRRGRPDAAADHGLRR